MAIVAGKKIGNLYSRPISAFESPIELGINVPYDDYRFLRAYEAHNFAALQGQPISTITTVNSIGDYVPEIAVNDFDGNRIKNTIIGPSSSSLNYSKGMIVTEQGYKTADKVITLSQNQSVDFSARDNVLITRTPLFLTSRTDSEGTTVIGHIREPKMAGIIGHANSFISYNSGGGCMEIVFDMTDKSSIDSDFVYRISFYYRAKCVNAVTLTLMTYYYTNEGALITAHPHPSITADRITSDTGDFSYFSMSIPYFVDGYSIPTNTKRMSFVLSINSGAFDPLIFEMIYPVLEHVFNFSRTVGYLFIPCAPSSISINESNSGNININEFGSLSCFDTAKLFPSHQGRKSFKIGTTWNLIDRTYVNQMRKLEQMNSMGYSVVFRTKHPDLPPVMIGDIVVDTSNPNYDFNDNELTIEFQEMI